MKAEELESGMTVKHPTTGTPVKVVRVSNGLKASKVYFKAKGQRGRFNWPPRDEVEVV